MKILCAGHVTYDITFPTDNFPVENTKNRFYEKEECAGGPSAIAAFLLGKWDEEVEFAGLVGNDDYGRRVQKEFSLNRIGTNNLVLHDSALTSHSLILANRSNGSRTVFCYVPKHISLEPFKLDYKPDIILIDGYEYEASKKLLLDNPSAISIIDAGREKKEVVELAKMVKYLVCSKEFAERVTGVTIDFNNKKTLAEIYNKMESMFNNTIVITLEAEGCLYKYNNQLKIMPSIRVKTVDSTGAGDIFHGAFTYGIAQGFDFEKVLKFANIAGALSVTRVGGYRSIPTLAEMNEVYEQVK